jgi:hypothetical protein
MPPHSIIQFTMRTGADGLAYRLGLNCRTDPVFGPCYFGMITGWSLGTGLRWRLRRVMPVKGRAAEPGGTTSGGASGNPDLFCEELTRVQLCRTSERPTSRGLNYVVRDELMIEGERGTVSAPRQPATQR